MHGSGCVLNDVVSIWLEAAIPLKGAGRLRDGRETHKIERQPPLKDSNIRLNPGRRVHTASCDNLQGVPNFIQFRVPTFLEPLVGSFSWESKGRSESKLEITEFRATNKRVIFHT